MTKPVRTRILTLGLVLGCLGLGAQTKEIFEDNFYRAPGGLAYCTLPELKNPETWKSELKSTPQGQRILQFTLVSNQGWRAFFNLMFTLKFVSEEDVSRGIQDLAEVQKKSSPFLQETGEVQKVPLFQGAHTLYNLQLAGKNKAGVRELCDVGAITDGTVVVLYILRGNEKDHGFLGKTLANPVFQSLRLGKTVLSLKDQNPSTRISGVWIGPYKINYSNNSGTQEWLLFDPRGYVTDRSPRGEIELDFDAAFQQKGKNAWLGVYQVLGKNLQITWLNGRNEIHDFTLSPTQITWDKATYTRLDGLFPQVKLSGVWEAASFTSSLGGMFDSFSFSSSSTYVFTADGKFSFDSLASAQGVRSNPGADTETRMSLLSNSSGKSPNRGTYKIEKDRLWLFFENGNTVSKPLFLRKDQGKPKDDILYIGGSNYLKE